MMRKSMRMQALGGIAHDLVQVGSGIAIIALFAFALKRAQSGYEPPGRQESHLIAGEFSPEIDGHDSLFSGVQKNKIGVDEPEQSNSLKNRVGDSIELNSTFNRSAGYGAVIGAIKNH